MPFRIRQGVEVALWGHFEEDGDWMLMLHMLTFECVQ